MVNSEPKINQIAAKYIERIAEISKKRKPLVAIHCITYNHEKYLRDALEGFVLQKTDFPFVAIVHEDASTDRTTEVLREYAEKYPDIILPIFEKENQYSKRNGSLGRIMKKACEVTGAKYIALCEGDDYWIDPQKLQKQVDFLEAHDDIIYTCHRFQIQNRNLPEVTRVPNSYLDAFPSEEGFEFDLQYVFKNEWVTKTLTSVYRKECLNYNDLKGCYFYRDVHNVYQILSRGNGYCFQFDGAVYRKQETGVWSQTDNLEQAYIEVKTWESIYKKIPTKFNLWKIRRNYTNYIIRSFREKKMFKITNFTELLAIFFLPIEIIKELKKTDKKQEITRIKQLGLNKNNNKFGIDPMA